MYLSDKVGGHRYLENIFFTKTKGGDEDVLNIIAIFTRSYNQI